MYNYHGSAKVITLRWGTQSYICGVQWGVYRGCGRRLLVAMEYYRVHIYDDVSRSGGPKEVPRGAQSTDGLYDADKGAMKAEGQARLELPRNPGSTSMDFCMCDTGCRVHVRRGDGTSKDFRGGHLDGASSCFAACMLLCILVAALHP